MPFGANTDVTQAVNVKRKNQAHLVPTQTLASANAAATQRYATYSHDRHKQSNRKEQ